MKTKVLFTLFFFLFLIHKAFCQTYFPMLDNSSWNIVVANFGGQQNMVINPGIDVVIGSFTYKKFIDPYSSEDVYLREDITSKKVYKRKNGNDQILYDFDLQVNNSITLGNGSTYSVTSITNVNVNGGTRKRFSLSNGFFNETWIEGVGSSHHPLIPSYELPSDPYIYLTCSAQNGINIYNHGIANGQPNPTDCSILLDLEDIDYSLQKINFSPNPFELELSITTQSTWENATFKVFNLSGQLVKEVQNINGNSIILNRENLQSGIYMFQIIQKGKLISTNKIIISD